MFKWIIGFILLILAAAVLLQTGILPLAGQIIAGKSYAYAHAYAEQRGRVVGKGESRRNAHAYAEQIVAGKSGGYARTYAEQIDGGKNPEYAHAYTACAVSPYYRECDIYAEEIIAGHTQEYASAYALVYRLAALNSDLVLTKQEIRELAEQIDPGYTPEFAIAYMDQLRAGKSESYAYAYTYAYTYAEQIRGKPYGLWHLRSPWIRDDDSVVAFARAYAEQIEAGRSQEYAHAYAYALVGTDLDRQDAREYAYARVIGGRFKHEAYYYAKQIDTDTDTIEAAFDVYERTAYEQAIAPAIVLAMYSTTDDAEAGRRVSSVREMTTHVGRGDTDSARTLDLLNDIAPEASIDARAKAADRLTSISEESDGELTTQQSMEVANELTRLITGYGIDAERRADAAREMVRLSQSGELNADNATELMDDIAPEWSVSERKEALGYLAWQFYEGEWDADSTKRTAEEGYRLVTGDKIQLEKRIDASVDLMGEVLKRYGGDSYDDEGIDQAVELTKMSLSGDLNVDSVAQILGLDSYDSDGQENSEKGLYDRLRDSGYSHVYARAYVRQIDEGRSHAYAGEYAHAYDSTYNSSKVSSWEAKEILKLLKDTPWQAVARAHDRADTLSHVYARVLLARKSEEYARRYARRLANNRYEYDGTVPRLRTYGEGGYTEEEVDEFRGGLRGGLRAGLRGPQSSKKEDSEGYERYIRSYAWAAVAVYSPGFAHDYASQIEEGKSHKYALAYAGYSKSRHEFFRPRVTVYPAHLYAEQIDAGKSKEYAFAYADYPLYLRIAAGDMEYVPAHADYSLDCAYTSCYSENYVYYPVDEMVKNHTEYAHPYAEAILEGKSRIYAGIYAAEIVAGRPELYAHEFAYAYEGQITSGGSPLYARAYAEKIAEGESLMYADAYAGQVEQGKSEEQAEFFAQWVTAGRPSSFAHIYIWVTGLVD